jgi:hypothetical protein
MSVLMEMMVRAGSRKCGWKMLVMTRTRTVRLGEAVENAFILVSVLLPFVARDRLHGCYWHNRDQAFSLSSANRFIVQ